MEQEIKKAMQKDMEETRKSFKGAPKELQVMNTKAENAMIANATGVKVQDVEQYSGKKRDEEMGKALENIAKLKVAQETGDRTRLGGEGSFLNKAFDKSPAHQEDLNKYYRDEGNKAEQEAAETLKQIYQALSGEGKGAKTEVAKGITPVDYSKYGDDTKWRQGQEAKEKEMDRQSRIEKVTNSLVRSGGVGLTSEEKKSPATYQEIAVSRVDKQMAKEEMQKKKQQEQEAAGGKGGGGNVTVAAPQINITVNGGGGGGGSAHDQADSLQRNVNSLIPELKANIEKVVKETFERRINSLEGRMDRVAMGNQSAKPIPIGTDSGSSAA